MKEIVLQLVCPLSMSREKQAFCLTTGCAAWNAGGYCNFVQGFNTIAGVLKEEL